MTSSKRSNHDSELRKKIVSIRSMDRINSNMSLSDFKVSINRLSNIRSVKIQNMIIPLSYYNINSQNNILIFDDPVIRVISLTPGTYTANQLAVELATRMSAASTLTFNVSFNSIVSKFSIVGTGVFNLLFANSMGPSLPEILGFQRQVYSGLSTYTSDNVVSINRLYSQLNVCSSRLSTHNQQVISSNQFLGNLICTVNNSVYKPGEYLYYSADDNSNSILFSNPMSSLDVIDIRIYDIDNNLIDFNGVDEICINLIVTYYP